MKESILKAIVLIVGIVIGVAFACGMIWGLWLLWSWAIPQIWPSGPVAIVHPSYLLFLAVWVIFVTAVGVLKR